MAGFQATHHAARRLCRDLGEQGAVWWLYDQADIYGWGVPFECSTSDLIEATRHRGKANTRGWATSFVQRLARTGCLTIVDPGSHRRVRLVSIPSPFTVQVGEQLRKQVSEHSKVDGTPAIEEDRTASRTGQKTEKRKTVFQEEEPKKKEEDKQPAYLAVLAALKSKANPKPSKLSAKQIKTFRAKTGATIAELELVAQAFQSCPDRLFSRDVRAEGWDDGTDRRKNLGTLLVQRVWPDRLAIAEEWRDSGKAKTTGAPKKDRPEWMDRREREGWIGPQEHRARLAAAKAEKEQR
jgi:hypothetical protein